MAKAAIIPELPNEVGRGSVLGRLRGLFFFLSLSKFAYQAHSNCLTTPSHSSEMDQQTFRALPVLIVLGELGNQMLQLLYASIGGEKAIIDGAQLNL